MNDKKVRKDITAMTQSLWMELQNGSMQMAVVGLGYVGLPMAVAFSKKLKVIGFDVNEKKIAMYRSGIDPTNEVGDNEVKQSTIYFTSNEEDLSKAGFFIVTVPTPVSLDKVPDLSPVIDATTMIGRHLVIGSAVVYNQRYIQVLQKIYAYLFWKGSLA
jgi:UDP-N-acetyl-D-galactosamine dehydrogenase